MVSGKAREPTAFIAVEHEQILGPERVIGPILGLLNAKELRDTGRMSVGNITIDLVTERQKVHDGNDSPLAAYYPSKRFLDRFDSIPNLSAILVAPLSESDVAEWKAIWTPTKLGSDQKTTPAPQIKDGIVSEALDTIVDRINPEDRLAGIRDRESTIEVFQTLQENGKAFDPLEVKAYLVSQKNLGADVAELVSDITRKVRQGKRFRIRDSWFPPSIMEIWEEKAKKNDIARRSQ